MTLRSHLTLRVAAVLALATLPSAAFAQGTEEQQQACTPDALKLCSDTIPDIGKTTACMKAHFSQLTPRCQSAFHDATGGGKAAPAHKTAESAKSRVATRGERHDAERHDTERHATEHRAVERRVPERSVASREERETVSAPARVDPPAAAAAVPPQAEGFPPFPSPDAPIARGTSRSQIADACRAGLIDSFTCTNTVPAILGAPVE